MPHRQQDLREPGAAEAQRRQRAVVHVGQPPQLRDGELHVPHRDLEPRARLGRLLPILAVHHRDDVAVTCQVLVRECRGQWSQRADDEREAPLRGRSIAPREQPRALQGAPGAIGDGAELGEKRSHLSVAPRDVVGVCVWKVRVHVIGERQVRAARRRGGRVPDVHGHLARSVRGVPCGGAVGPDRVRHLHDGEADAVRAWREGAKQRRRRVRGWRRRGNREREA